jgi:hypothetical protein
LAGVAGGGQQEVALVDAQAHQRRALEQRLAELVGADAQAQQTVLTIATQAPRTREDPPA